MVPYSESFLPHQGTILPLHLSLWHLSLLPPQCHVMTVNLGRDSAMLGICNNYLGWSSTKMLPRLIRVGVSNLWKWAWLWWWFGLSLSRTSQMSFVSVWQPVPRQQITFTQPLWEQQGSRAYINKLLQISVQTSKLILSLLVVRNQTRFLLQ